MKNEIDNMSDEDLIRVKGFVEYDLKGKKELFCQMPIPELIKQIEGFQRLLSYMEKEVIRRKIQSQ